MPCYKFSLNGTGGSVTQRFVNMHKYNTGHTPILAKKVTKFCQHASTQDGFDNAKRHADAQDDGHIITNTL